MSSESVPELENVDEEIADKIIESESSESEIMDDEGSFVDDLELDLDLDDIDLDENDLDDELFQDSNDLFELTELLSSVTTTEEGDTICTALVDISRPVSYTHLRAHETS